MNAEQIGYPMPSKRREACLFGTKGGVTTKAMDMPLGLALEVAVECWSWLAETGLPKSLWPGWVERGIWPDDNWCTVCMCAIETGGHADGIGCPTCIVFESYGGCHNTGFRAWRRARTAAGRKRAARRFLRELEALR